VCAYRGAVTWRGGVDMVPFLTRKEGGGTGAYLYLSGHGLLASVQHFSWVSPYVSLWHTRTWTHGPSLLLHRCMVP
jgi:hypothetical protein